jgi:hypothetical protein
LAFFNGATLPAATRLAFSCFFQWGYPAGGYLLGVSMGFLLGFFQWYGLLAWLFSGGFMLGVSMGFLLGFFQWYMLGVSMGFLLGFFQWYYTRVGLPCQFR